ncbi:MAG: HypC/HybG/HupF family hydrogenase formation chaperone [Acidobacteria bacterium]|nr:HypC/HybG/HupF family hydrogenase formation chaperone [Acidobacteriota bacterium]MCB9397628.1 HypC/HybG/HupF family hydrogenase formation chaperone [Acidobacteriota bacterium]
MCLAIPGRIDQIVNEFGLRMAWIDYGGTRRKVCLEYTPEANEDEYVIVHAGFAISVLDETAARETLDALHALGELPPTGGEP